MELCIKTIESDVVGYFLQHHCFLYILFQARKVKSY